MEKGPSKNLPLHLRGITIIGSRPAPLSKIHDFSPESLIFRIFLTAFSLRPKYLF
jgi:hypothetical protein